MLVRRSVVLVGRSLQQKNVVSAAASVAPRCCFNTAAEPKFMVRSDPRPSYENVKVPYLRDHVRQEIYARHVSDPEKWTLAALSQHYHTSLDRTKSVIVLMHRRYEMIRAKGFAVHIDKQHFTVTVEVPAPWRELYQKHLEDPTKDAEAVLQSHNEAVQEERLKLRINGEQAKQIIETVKDHERRSKNLDAHNAHMEEVLSLLAQRGVNTNFAETANDVVMKGGKKSLKDSYYPSLFGDEDLEAQREKLLKRIANETKARVEFNAEYFEEKFAPAAGNTLTKGEKKTSPETVSRWKMAFRDLSQIDTQAGQNDVTRTLIRSRRGE